MSMKKMLTVVAAAALVAVAAPAFAANPFSDVPMNHWAYDAVESLAAKGILDGYPNGTFKGNKAMTRYEIATVVARALANGGAGADVEKLKALVVEFQPELEALGVKVDGFDGRISKLEKGLGGLKISAQLRLDYKSFDGNEYADKDGFTFSRARIMMHKDLAEGVSWDMRWHANKVDRFFLTMKDAFGMKGLRVKIGQYFLDWEGEDGLYTSGQLWDDNALFFDGTTRGVNVQYKKGGLTVEGFYSSNNVAGSTGVYTANAGDEVYGARLKYAAAKWALSANMYHFGDDDYKVYWFGASVKPLNGVTVKGAYFMEKLGGSGSDPKAWKAMVELDQSLLKITDLKVEYTKLDKDMIVMNTDLSTNGIATRQDAKVMADDTKIWTVKAVQQWTKKFATFEHFSQFDQEGADKAKEWSVGVNYKYSSNLQFVLDYTDYNGKFMSGAVDPKDIDKVIRFRTYLAF